MKILKMGEIPGERIYRHTCYKCKTLFEFARKEAREVADGRNGIDLHVNCPLCNNDCFAGCAAGEFGYFER